MTQSGEGAATHTVAEFSVKHTRFLGKDGVAVAPLPEFGREAEALVPMYRAMVLARAFDTKCIALQRTGRLGTFPSPLGQEAVAIGIAAAMRADDVFVPSFREPGTQLWRGVRLVELFLQWGGDERGNDFENCREDLPNAIPIGSQIPHAAGVALAFRLRGQERAAVCVCGDGATSKGDFYTGLNFAGLMHLPVVYVINNNQWAISISRERQTAAETLAQKAVAAGISCEQVDGNDAVAVRFSVEQALERCRRGEGPHLIEAITYRLGDHTTADDASRYRSDEEVSTHWAEEPVLRMRNHLVAEGAWSRDDEENLKRSCTAEVDAAAEEYLAIPPQPAESMFDFVYGNVPKSLEVQRAEVAERSHRKLKTSDA